MIIKTKKVYYCGHCKKHRLTKPAMEHHEKLCFNNPENKRPCLECCQHLTKKITSIFEDGYGYDGEREERVNLFYCLAKKTFLYTPQNEVKKNYFETDEENNPMPKTCTDYKFNY